MDNIVRKLLPPPMPNNNALHDAAKYGNVAEVRSQVRNFDINARGESGRTPLYWAVKEGHTEAVKLLLTLNADVKIPNEHGLSALAAAANNGHTEVVQALLKAPAINVNQADVSTYLLTSSHVVVGGRG